MLKVDSIEKGIVLDHIQAGKAMQVYQYLNLDRLDCSVAIIKNVKSNKMGKKDIIKINDTIDINLDVLGYIDPNITVNIIENDVTVEKKRLELPEKIVNVVKCKNPRCITSTEQELDHVFKLADRESGVYRCIYCDQKATHN
ncbi:aspartate carbamoyltransferase regulatory subunit [Cuneatibacter sp. NSJ-177]|uniref:aspartate carbamoyltransferase regulatory subunit n=1 Tax=Cuneatibacter sp. NSJ-177 TaxID=2931401 RepID=UPI001FD48149|nr:aspartate carbamoyltransferase regulatory subunit [Cuneatibacter sp. NSJ-177]MCJ7835870.1 aspartate carbamoyltransferase regulatory subunit [Cuneatibacter sp. NSJ-177]